MDRRSEQQRRRTALRALAVERTVRTRSGGPAPVLEAALEVFGSEEALLLAAHQLWQVHLLARLDQLLETGPADPHDVVGQAVAELGDAQPGLAALLADHAEDPVLARARQRLAGYVELACPCGRQHALVTAPRSRRRKPHACPLAGRGRVGIQRLSAAVRRRGRWFTHGSQPLALGYRSALATKSSLIPVTHPHLQ
jgi:hypothetical protein